jgi:hypothetical protein
MSIRKLPEEFNRFFLGEAGCIPDGFVDILRFEVGVGLTDGLLGFSRCQEPKET